MEVLFDFYVDIIVLDGLHVFFGGHVDLLIVDVLLDSDNLVDVVFDLANDLVYVPFSDFAVGHD